MTLNDHTSIKDIALTNLQALTEADLTKRFLVPLFKNFGFDRVDYYGGQYEGGKDLICWRNDELKMVELAVVQVKKYKPTVPSADTKSFSEIVTQLQQASEKKIPNIDGIEYQPSLLYFVTPYTIDTRALQSRFEAYSSLKPRRVKIIDGPLLIDLLSQKLEPLYRNLVGKNVLMQTNLMNNLTNADLLAALEAKYEKDISSFYCDLDFGFGNVSTSLFLSLDFRPIAKAYNLSTDEWLLFKESSRCVEDFFGVNIITPSYDEIEGNYEKERKKRKEGIKKGLKEIPENMIQISSALERIEMSIENQREKLENFACDSEEYKLNECYELILIELLALKQRSGIESSNKHEDKKNYNKINNLTKKTNDHEMRLFGKSTLINQVKSYLKNLKKLREIDAKRGELFEQNYEISYKFSLDGKELSARLIEKKKWLLHEANKFGKETSNSELKAFLMDCKSLIDAVDKAINNPILTQVLGLLRKHKYLNTKNTQRLNISIDNVFSTGLHFIVLGEAGAGKTTTLQMYTKKNLAKANDTKQFLFLPLARIAASLSDELLEKDEIKPLEKLQHGIRLYLKAQGINISEIDFLNMLNNKSMVLLLDGIDESISRLPWIIEVINKISMRYPKVQLITSSRMSGEYLKNISFCGIILLPFSDYQREHFIRKWFNESDTIKIDYILKHIKNNPNLGNVVRNPLHATILCVLADHNIPLPESELQLYEERIKLLMGKYDFYKRATRLKSRQHDLEIVAQKIAYRLHSMGIRHDSLLNLKRRALGSLQGKLPEELVLLAVNELADPCNILMPMTEDGQFGFEHLQFQEYLAACELRNNRGIEIGPLMYNNWWRGPLVFFAQITDEIEFIIKWLAVEGNFSSAAPTLNAMLAVRPEKEKKELREILTKHYELDVFDERYEDVEYLLNPIRGRTPY